MPFSGQNEGKEEADIEWEEVGITAGGQFKLSIWRQVSLVWVTSSAFLKTDPLGHKWRKVVRLANEKPGVQYTRLNDLLWGNCIHIHYC